MKHAALAIAAILSLALVAPVFAQPFADVPTDHWAFDAIAELAAKGLIEGYPDGTFKGDRAMTRYEMAMVVARLLARIEAIKIPEPPKIPPPEVTRADIDRITRLVNEFRAELAAQGVRLTAVEEELNALRARLDNTRVTGDVRFRYNIFPSGSVSGSATGRTPDIRLRSRITFTGRVTPDVTATVRLWAANNTGLGGILDTRFGNTAGFGSVTFDYLYLDINTPWLVPMTWRVGRQPVSLGGLHGPFDVGLLFDEANFGYFTGVNDGVTLRTNLGPLNIFAFALQSNCSVTAPCPSWVAGLGGPPWINHYAVRGEFMILPGWTLGGTFYTERNPGVSPGSTVGTRGNGFSVDIAGSIVSGVDAYVDFASWTMSGFSSSSAWRAGVLLDLGKLANISMFAPSLELWYNSYGGLPAGAAPPVYTYACTLNGGANCFNMRGWGVDLNMTFTPKLNGEVLYEWGDLIVGGGTYSELWARLTYALATRTSLSVQYFKLRAGNPIADFSNFVRFQLTYSW